jgi:beta-glucosidase
MAERTYKNVETNVLYPFGYGLTYSTVEINNAKYQNNCVICQITNIGETETDEVVQVYVKSDSEFAAKNPVLCGFKRVHLNAKECREVAVDLSVDAFTDVDFNGLRKVFGKRFTLFCGVSQPDKQSETLCGVKAFRIEINSENIAE